MGDNWGQWLQDIAGVAVGEYAADRQNKRDIELQRSQVGVAYLEGQRNAEAGAVVAGISTETLLLVGAGLLAVLLVMRA